MAENIENEISFSIQDTMELGSGNQALLEGLYEPETASADPKKVTPIINETSQQEPTLAPEVKAGKEITPVAEDADRREMGQAIISNFLGDNTNPEEAEEVQTPTTTEPAASTEGNEPEPGGTQFGALSTDLLNLGVFTKNEGEEDIVINSGEEFLERFHQEKRKGASEMVENFLGQFGEDYRNAFDAIFVKGVNPKDYFGTYNTIVNFAEMDLSQEANQIKVVRQTLSDQGFESEEDIDTEIERLKSYGDLEQVANRHHKVLVKKQAGKLHEMEAQAERELQEKAQLKNQYIKNVQDVLADKMKAKDFDGIPLNPKLAGELQDFLLVDKWKTASGETLTDFDRTILDLKRPENHAMKVKVALLLKILEKDPGLTTIQKTGITQKSDKLFSEVARQTTNSNKGGGNTRSNSSSSNTPWSL